MKVDDGLEILELSTISTGREGIINPVFLWDDKTAILIDTGLPGQKDMIKEKITELGLATKLLKKIIITHHDIDHVGSLKKFQDEGDYFKTISHIEEKPFIEFAEKPLKMAPEKVQEMEQDFKAKVDICVNHGDVLDDCGGIIIIHTPGHTPGHVSLYLKKYQILIAGDALNVVGEELLGPHPRFSSNYSQAKQSLLNFLDYDIDTVICYHGGLYKGDIKKKISQLLEDNN